MVAKGARDRRTSSTNNVMNNSKRRIPSSSQEKKKIAKPIGICGFCLGTDEKNADGKAEEMIHCAECGNSGHPSCLQYSERLVKKIRTINWQCIDCKMCIICSKSDDSLLFCDFCDCGIHLQCCDPPLENIPKGDFACHLCRPDVLDELNSPSKRSLVKTMSSSSIRSRSSLTLNGDESNGVKKTSPINNRPTVQLFDGTSNFFLTKKQKSNGIRQNSVQKAMKILREKKRKKILKRLDPTNLEIKARKENIDVKDPLIEEDISSPSKTQRSRKKNNHLCDDLILNPQTSTPLTARQSTTEKLLHIEPVTTPTRLARRSETNLNRSNNQRKQSTNSISPISLNLTTNKKRSRPQSPPKKIIVKNVNGKKRKPSQTDGEQSEEIDIEETKSSNNKRKLNIDFSKYDNVPAFIKDPLPDSINENDVHLFLEAKTNSVQLTNECSENYHHSSETIGDDSSNTRWPPYIVLGSDLIKTWYSSSYPQEYARVPRLYICEFCLKYMKCEQVYDRHRKTCTARHPPANEIYHKDDLSVFEVDGNINRIYCQNLCLLAKLFLDHKTLYYDVEPFLFYVLTRNDSSGCHFIGYFSKEKHCPQKYNLSCITVLPICQRRGYGRFLIDLSYLLSKKESLIGTPERPLSTLGAQTYEAYWKLKIIEQLLVYHQENRTKCTVKSLVNDTGMTTDDIIDTLQNLGVLTMKSNGKAVITVDVTHLEIMIRNERIKHSHWVSLDPEYVRFTPVLTPHLLSNEEKAVEKEVKEIQIVFKEIGRDAAEAASQAANDTADGSNGTEVVRYVRRRKCGQKRRSVYVKRRMNVSTSKLNKNESIITNEDSCTTRDTITNDDDDHSQEYVARRPVSLVDETNKDEENKVEQPEVEKAVVTPTSPILAIAKTPSKTLNYKQLKLDQFLKIHRPITSINEALDTLNETSKLSPISISVSDAEKEKLILNQKVTDQTEEISDEIRKINRHTRLHSETDQLSSHEDKLEENHQQTNGYEDTNGVEQNQSTIADNQITSDRPLPLKKRALTSSNVTDTNGTDLSTLISQDHKEITDSTHSISPNKTILLGVYGAGQFEVNP